MIRLIKPWRKFQAGKLLDLSGGVEDVLVRMKKVAEYENASGITSGADSGTTNASRSEKATGNLRVGHSARRSTATGNQ